MLFRTLTYMALALSAMAIAGSQVSGLAKLVQSTNRPAGPEAHESNAAASMLGQFRTSVSSWLWLRTDTYLHNGVEMRPLTEEETRMGQKGEDADPHEEEVRHEGEIVTVVPSADRDFRGVFGDIERATQTYKDMHHHTHNDPKVALPLFRLMTWIDPQFVPGWTTGASVLALEKSDAGVSKALAYLNSGFEANPKSIAIASTIGSMLASKRRAFVQAKIWLERARSLALVNIDAHLDEEDSDALLDAYRWLTLVYRELGEPGARKMIATEGLKLFPGDGVLQRAIEVDFKPVLRHQ